MYAHKIFIKYSFPLGDRPDDYDVTNWILFQEKKKEKRKNKKKEGRKKDRKKKQWMNNAIGLGST